MKKSLVLFRRSQELLLAVSKAIIESLMPCLKVLSLSLSSPIPCMLPSEEVSTLSFTNNCEWFFVHVLSSLPLCPVPCLFSLLFLLVSSHVILDGLEDSLCMHFNGITSLGKSSIPYNWFSSCISSSKALLLEELDSSLPTFMFRRKK